MRGRNSDNNQRKIIFLTIILVVLALSFTFYIVLKDISESSKLNEVDLASPETLIESLNTAVAKRSYLMLDEIFDENHYSSIFGELFFDKMVEISFGFSDNSEITKKRIVTSNDFPNVKKGEIKYLTDYLATAILIVDEVNTKPDSSNDLVLKNALNVAFLMQKFGNQWTITKLYDFMTIDSDYLEIRDFKLHYLDNSFELDLKHKDYLGNIETTVLYNFALSINSIEILSDENVLCNFTRDDISMYQGERVIPLRSDSLKNPDKLLVSGKCDYNSIITGDFEQKYLLYVVINTDQESVLLRYYGDLLL